MTAKGKAEPVPASPAVAPRSRFGVEHGDTGKAPLVGRTRELALLTDALARVRSDERPQLVTVVGVPGIGKSRLVHELWQQVDDDQDLIVWRRGRSLPYGEGIAYWALGEIVKAQAGILESDDAPETEAKLGAAVGALLSDRGEAAWVERHLRPLTGLPVDESTPSGRRRSPPAAASSKRSPRMGPRSSSSRTSTGRTTTCSTSSTSWPTGSTRYRS